MLVIFLLQVHCDVRSYCTHAVDLYLSLCCEWKFVTCHSEETFDHYLFGQIYQHAIADMVAIMITHMENQRWLCSMI